MISRLSTNGVQSMIPELILPFVSAPGKLMEIRSLKFKYGIYLFK